MKTILKSVLCLSYLYLFRFGSYSWIFFCCRFCTEVIRRWDLEDLEDLEGYWKARKAKKKSHEVLQTRKNKNFIKEENSGSSSMKCFTLWNTEASIDIQYQTTGTPIIMLMRITGTSKNSKTDHSSFTFSCLIVTSYTNGKTWNWI